MLPPKALASPDVFDDAADGERRAGRRRCRAAARLPVVMPCRSANSFDSISESGCARKISGSSIAVVAAGVEVVVAQTPIAGHVDAEHQQIAFALDVRVDDDLDDGHRDAHGRRRLHGVEHVLAETRLHRR